VGPRGVASAIGDDRKSMGDIYCVLGKLRDVSPILHPLVEISLKVAVMNYMYFSKRKRLKVATSM
jgi:hypothetical protein